MGGNGKPMVRRSKTLLIDLPNWIGDVVMALPAVATLVKSWDGETVLGCRPPVARFLQMIFPDASVVAVDRRTPLLEAARRLTTGRGRFHTAITLRHATRAKLLLRLTARRTFGSTGGGGRLLLTQAFPVDRKRHQVHDADPILHALGLPPVDPSWRPRMPPALIEEGHAAFERAGMTPGRIAGLAPGAAWGPSKQWPVESFAKLARMASTAGLTPVVFIGPGEEPLATWVTSLARHPVAALGSDLDVAGLFGALAASNVVISNDSGPMHLAALAGVPVVALFGPTDPRRTAPLITPHRILDLQLACSPCFKPHCPLGHRRCLDEITPEMVASAAWPLAKAPSPASPAHTESSATQSDGTVPCRGSTPPTDRQE